MRLDVLSTGLAAQVACLLKIINDTEMIDKTLSTFPPACAIFA